MARRGVIDIQGADQYKRLARALKHAGNGAVLRKELNKAIQLATRPIVKEIRVEARMTLPRAGGLNRYVARSSIKTKKYTGSNPGVVIRASKTKSAGGKKVDIRRINKGSLRHPLYGNRRNWYLQAVPPGFWSRPTNRAAKRTRKELKKAMSRIARRISLESS